jgi:adenylate cyclase
LALQQGSSPRRPRGEAQGLARSPAIPRQSPTLLEISRQNKIAHVSVCGGNARCSTCRVRIVQGAEDLPAPGDAEKSLLERISAPKDVRLACQIHPSTILSIARLLKPGNHSAHLTAADETGVVRQTAILFIDIRDFTEA